MENQIQIFSNPEFGTVRTLGDWENPLFCLPDVCKILDLRVDNVITRLKDDPFTAGGISLHPIADSLGRIQMTNFVNESSLYIVIFQSRKPNALKFQHWVTNEVLPSIRHYGYYVAPNATFDIDLILKLIPEINLTEDQINLLKTATPMLEAQTSAMIKRLLANYEKNNDVTALVVLDLPGEIWIDVNDFLGFYQISTKGRTRSFHRGTLSIMTPHPNEDGHLHIGLYKNGKTTTYAVHRLVAEAFIPNPLNLPEVDHKDGNPANNDVTNLRWCTRKQNAEFAVENGAYKIGEENHNAKLTVKKVREIRAKYKPRSKTNGIKALAKEYGVSRSTIEHIVYNQVWRHVQ